MESPVNQVYGIFLIIGSFIMLGPRQWGRPLAMQEPDSVNYITPVYRAWNALVLHHPSVAIGEISGPFWPI